MLIHGDNGTGKSSIERALRWALLGDECPTPDASFTTEDSFRRNVLTDTKSPRVEIDFVDRSTINVSPEQETFAGAGAQIRQGLCAGPPFLRRTELLYVLRSKPGARFAYFDSFLDLGTVDTAIKDLGDAKASREKQITLLRHKLDNQYAALASLYPAPEDFRASEKAFEMSVVDGAAKLKLVAPEATFGTAAASLLGAAEQAQSGDMEAGRASLRRGADACEAALAALPPEPESVEHALAEWDEMLASHPPSPPVDLIEHAIRHFETQRGEVCPVCEQAVDWDDSLASLRTRSDSLKELRESRATRIRILDAWRGILQTVDRAYEAVQESPLDPAVAFHSMPGVDLVMPLTPITNEALEGAISAMGSSALYSHLCSTLRDLVTKARDASDKMPAADQMPDLQLCAALAQRLLADGAQLQLVEAQHHALAEETKTISLVHEALRKERQDVARKTLKGMGELVAAYYAFIHPPELEDEATGAPSIDVQGHGKGTAYVRGLFYGHAVSDPSWVYSDGHLDTVGICIFLALRRSRAAQKSDPKILVLDDIVLSIDLGHARRLIKLLNEEFMDHQIFMLTHNGLFASWCQNLMPRMRRVQIAGWTLDGGPKLGDFVQAAEKVELAIEDGAPKDIALRIMELMDEWLGEARLAYRLPVEARYGEQYTLSDIWQPFAKRVKDIGRRLGSDLGGAIDVLPDLADLPAIRNMTAAHDNDFAKEFP